MRRPTRRELLRAGAVLLAGTAAGCAGSNLPAARAAARPRRRSRELDVCILGSGFAGTFLALRLAELGVRSVVLEAGGAVDSGRPEGRAELFPIDSIGRLRYPIEDCRTIGVGGTSHRWTGVVARLQPSDFKTRSRFGFGADWPLAYEDLEPYYCLAERRLDTQGPAEGAEGPRSCGFPFFQPPAERPHVVLEGQPLAFGALARSKRGGSGSALRLTEVEIPRLLDSADTELRPNLVALRLLTTDGGTIESVEVRDAGGTISRIQARRFVVAAGVFESARLLLASRADTAPAGLGNGGGWVGRGFTEHPDLRATWETGSKSLTHGIFRSTSTNDRLRAEGLGACHIQLRATRKRTVIYVQPELEPIREHGLALDGSKRDADGRPRMTLDFDLAPRDERSIARALGFRQTLARSFGLDPAAGATWEGWRYHPTGTCRMAQDASQGVVDANLRVFGTENLFVCGASTFPTAGTANPTNTVVALALRLADHLAVVAG